MRRLLTGYAQQFNRRHRRSDVLFQNRYKSILCEEDSYLLELVRYIHLNPVRAGVIPDSQALRDYPGCGHSALMGRVARDWQATDYVLSFFGRSLRGARKAYQDFVARGVAEGSRPELVGGGLIRSAGGWQDVKLMRHSGMRVMGDERILGSGEFVDSVLRHARERYEKTTIAQRRGINLDTLIERAADHFGVDPAGVLSAGRQRAFVRVRALVCALAIDRLGMNGRELACRLNLSASAVSKLAQRGRMDKSHEKSAAAVFMI